MTQVLLTDSILACIKRALASLNDGCGVVEIHCQHGKVRLIKRQDVFLPEGDGR